MRKKITFKFEIPDSFLSDTTLKKNDIYEIQQDRLFFKFTILFTAIFYFFSLFYYFFLNITFLAQVLAVAGLFLFSSIPVYRFSKSRFYAANNFLLWIHWLIIIVTYYTGGSDSSVILWAVFAPYLAALLISTRAALFYAGIIIVEMGGLFYLDYVKMVPPTLLTSWQTLFFDGLSYFMIIFFSGVLAYLNRKEVNDTIDNLNKRNEDLQELVGILVHDINNSLTVVIHHSNQLVKSITDEKDNQRLIRIQNSTANIREIVEYTRDIRAIEEGKKRIKLASVKNFEEAKKLENPLKKS